MSPSSMQQQVESQLLASYESLYRLAYTYVKNPDDAMDVVQESAFKAISRSADVRSPAAIRGWLCRIVVNTAMDVLRARSRQADAEHIPETGQEDRTGGCAGGSDALGAVSARTFLAGQGAGPAGRAGADGDSPAFFSGAEAPGDRPGHRRERKHCQDHFVPQPEETEA